MNNGDLPSGFVNKKRCTAVKSSFFTPQMKPFPYIRVHDMKHKNNVWRAAYTACSWG